MRSRCAPGPYPARRPSAQAEHNQTTGKNVKAVTLRPGGRAAGAERIGGSPDDDADVARAHHLVAFLAAEGFGNIALLLISIYKK